MSDTKPPISLRLDESVIFALQKEARKQSYEQDKDISYVELVRGAVAGYIQSLTKDVVDPVVVEVGRSVVSVMSGDTMEKPLGSGGSHLADVKIKDVLRFLGLNFDDPVGKAIAADVQDMIEEQSLGRVLLEVHNLEPGEYPKYKRDVASVSQVISRRGAVPDKLVEGDYVMVPTFEIAAHPSFRYDDILSGNVMAVGESNLSCSNAIVKEEEYNVLNAIKASVEYKQDQAIITDGSVTIGHLEQAYAKIARHSLFAKNMVCNYATFSNIRSSAAGMTGDWSFESDPKNPKHGGRFRTATIHITDRLCDGEVIFTADPKAVGRLPIKIKPMCVPSNEPSKLRGGYVLWESIGICILNDYAVSAVFPKDSQHAENILKAWPQPVPTVEVKKTIKKRGKVIKEITTPVKGD